MVEEHPILAMAAVLICFFLGAWWAVTHQPDTLKDALESELKRIYGSKKELQKMIRDRYGIDVKKDEVYEFMLRQQTRNSKSESTMRQTQSHQTTKKVIFVAESPSNANVIPNIIGKHYNLEQLRQIQMGSIRLQPIDAGIVFDEQQQNVVQILANASPKIKQYLPNLNLSSPEAVAHFFTRLCKKTELGYEFGYSIKQNNAGDAAYLGFIFIHTPSYNSKSLNFPHWTIDFCLFELYEGNGIMRNSLIRVLDFLKNVLGVSEVYAIVDEYNMQSIKLLQLLPFDCLKQKLSDPGTGNRANLFCCNLTNLNFQHR